MSLEELELMTSYYIDKAKNEGLEKHDHNQIRKIINKARHLKEDTAKWYKIMADLHTLSKLFDKSGIHTGFRMDIDYMQENAFILPLVMANNNGPIRITDNKVYFNSQFAHDEKGLMQVKINSNEVHCKKSHTTLHNIAYIQNMEHIERIEALFLICYIFNYRIPTQVKELLDLSQKYKRIITSSEYKELLFKLFQSTDPILQSKLNEIIRIENDIYDSEFVCEEAPNRLYLR